MSLNIIPTEEEKRLARVEEKRLARNKQAREKRAIAKQQGEGKVKPKPISYAEKEKRKAEMENSEEWKTMKAELQLLNDELERKNAILYEPIPLIRQKMNANLIVYCKIVRERENFLEAKFGL
jgi:hypothetical protein